MRELIEVGLVLALHGVALALLALTQDKHARAVLGRAVSAGAARCRALGVVGLALSLALAVATRGAAFGCLLWILLWSLNGLVVALLLAWLPRGLRPLAQRLRG